MSEFDIKTRELELKYDAGDVSLSDFIVFAKSLNPERFLEVASWDSYYSAPDNSSLDFEFMRFRQGPKPELTIKRQLSDKNNLDRIEIDLPLDPNLGDVALSKIVDSFCQQFNFTLNFKIYKYCSIYFYEKVDIVYYIVYSPDMKERGRFMEIEAMKDAEFKDQEEAWTLVKEMEQKFSALGITPQRRIKKSQWQMWRKT